MAIQQIAKPRDSVVLGIRTPSGDSLHSSEIYVIFDTGTLKLPRLEPEISAAGVPFDRLIQRINETSTKSGIQPVPAVEKISFPMEGGCLNHVLKVVGAVQNPGEFPLRQGMTLTSVIGKADGFAGKAEISKVRLIRGKQETVYDLRILQLDGSNNPALMDGDEIVVPQDPASVEIESVFKPEDSVVMEME
ncbi:MAG: hypothetical protein JWL81_146, partial [Verrucomicrobiales bacterium]|nr:hypothetical protein [Verrucomicrobiales bacterium]